MRTDHIAQSDYNKALKTVDPQILAIEIGNSYRTSHLFSSVANDASANVYIKTGNYVVAGKSKYYVTKSCEIFFYESGIIDSSGSALTLINYNRNSANTPTTEVYYTPTIETSGNEILHAYITVASSGSPIATSAASAEEDTFWLLKPNTNYIITIWNRSGGDAANFYIDLRARDEVNYEQT